MSEIEELMKKIIEGSGLELDKTLKQVRAMKGKSNAEPLIEQLLDVVKDLSLFYRKRRNAIYALGELKSNRAVEALIESLNDKDVNVRISAAVALGEIGDSLAVDSLMKRLRDENARVRDAVVWALDEISLN